jgi:hypothetical protein
VVCHTLTAVNNYGIAKFREDFTDASIVAEYINNGVNHADDDNTCDECHQKHESGFAPPASCGVCHGGNTGDGMNTDNELVSKWRVNNTDAVVDTGSQSIGAHPVHAGSPANDRAGLDCYEPACSR